MQSQSICISGDVYTFHLFLEKQTPVDIVVKNNKTGKLGASAFVLRDLTGCRLPEITKDEQEVRLRIDEAHALLPEPKGQYKYCPYYWFEESIKLDQDSKTWHRSVKQLCQKEQAKTVLSFGRYRVLFTSEGRLMVALEPDTADGHVLAESGRICLSSQGQIAFRGSKAYEETDNGASADLLFQNSESRTVIQFSVTDPITKIKVIGLDYLEPYPSWLKV